MSMREQIDRAYAREEAALFEHHKAGRLSKRAFNTAVRELQREAREEAAAAMQAELEAVRQEWA